MLNYSNLDFRPSRYIRHIFFLLLAIVYSCGSTKSIVKGPPPLRTQEAIEKALADNEVNFTWYNAKIGANITSPDFSGGATIVMRMEADRIIWAQFKKLAVEGGRALATRDSFFVINRIERSYQQGSMQGFFEKTENKITFLDFQKLFLGNVFPSKLLTITRFEQQGKECYIDAIVKDTPIKLKYIVDPYSQLVSKLDYRDDEGNYLLLTLGDYRTNRGKELPYEVSVMLNYKGVEYGINLEIKDLELDVQKEMIFSIPSHYEEIIK